MEERASGFILRTRPLTETSLIVHWLTESSGRLSTVARGARRSKSVFRGKLDLYYEAQFSFHRSKRSTLHGLKEVKLLETHPALRLDVVKLRQAAYAAQLIEQSTEEETPLEDIYHLFAGYILDLDMHEATSLRVLSFEIKLLILLGLAPDLKNTPSLSGGSTAVLKRCAHTDWSSLGNLKISTPQTNELRHFLGMFMCQHLGRVMESRKKVFQTK